MSRRRTNEGDWSVQIDRYKLVSALEYSNFNIQPNIQPMVGDLPHK